MAVGRAKAEKFLDELATLMYDLRTKYGISQDDFVCEPVIRIDEYVTRPEAFKNVSKVT